MKKTAVNLLAAFWLLFVTPFFGIFPLLMLLGVRLGSFEYTERNLLRGIWAPLLGDPGAGVEDAGPPLSRWEAYAMIAVTLGVAVVALIHLYRELLRSSESARSGDHQ